MCISLPITNRIHQPSPAPTSPPLDRKKQSKRLQKSPSGGMVGKDWRGTQGEVARAGHVLSVRYVVTWVCSVCENSSSSSIYAEHTLLCVILPYTSLYKSQSSPPTFPQLPELKPVAPSPPAHRPTLTQWQLIPRLPEGSSSEWRSRHINPQGNWKSRIPAFLPQPRLLRNKPH